MVLCAFGEALAQDAAPKDAQTPAESAASDPLVPLDDVADLSIPEDELGFDEALLELPIVRVEVRVTGQRWAAKPVLNSVKFGEKLSPESARRAMRELAMTGSFVKMAAEAERAGSGVVLRIVAVPSRTIAAIQIDGGVLERSGTLRAAGLVVGDEVSEADLDAVPAKVATFYDTHGFPDAAITVQAAQLDDPLSVLVVVSITPNEPRLVSQRIFVIEPHQDVHVGDLKFDYAVKAGERLDDFTLAEADRTLSQALREEGFYTAKVVHKTKIVGDFVYLYVYVDSGPKLVPIFEGSFTFDHDQLFEALELERGQFGSTDELVTKLQQFYEARGFLDAVVTTEARPSADPGLENVAFEIVENDRVGVTKRTFACLDPSVDPDDVGSEIDTVLETELPAHSFVSVPDPRIIDAALTTVGPTGSRPAPLELSPATTYTPEAYASALKRVREVFLSKGYLNAIVGPITVVRARCSASSPAGECIEEAVPEVRAVCKTTDEGLPLPEPAAPLEVTCVPNAALSVRCSPRITLRIPVHLGPVTKVWDLAFEGNAHATAKELAEVAKMPLGAELSLKGLEDAKTRIGEYYQDRGYAYVGVDADVELSPDRTRGRVRFFVQERDLVFIDDIDVEGATRTDHALIRRRIAFQKNDVYSRTKLRQSEERLATLGAFSSVSVSLADPEVINRRKRIIVRVSEYPSQFIDPKVGFSTGEGLRFGLEYGHRNIASLAIALTLRIQLSYLFDFMILDSDVEENLSSLSASERLERRNSVRVSFPEIGLGPLVSFGIEAVDVRDNQRDFGLSRQAIVPSLTYRPLKEVVATFSASVELNDEKIFNGDSVNEAIKNDRRLANLLRFPDGATFAVAQRIGVSWDRRDAPFAATSGTLLTGDIEHVNALPADPDDPDTDPLVSHFLKLNGRFAGYIRLTDSGIAIAASISAGMNIQLRSGSKTYPDRLFYQGGFDSIRSFLADSMVPEDVARQILEPPPDVEKSLTIDDVAVRGGDLYWNPRVELRVPLTGIWAIGVFLDTGNLYVDPLNFRPWELRFGLGGGIRISTPVGPIAFDGGFNVDPRPWEDIGALHFSIGLF